MKIKIKLLKPFSDAVGNKELYIDFNGRTLGDLVKKLVESYPELKNEFKEKHVWKWYSQDQSFFYTIKWRINNF